MFSVNVQPEGGGSVLTCMRPERRRQVRVGEQRLSDLSVLLHQFGERSHAQPAETQLFVVVYCCHLNTVCLPVGGLGFQRPVAEASVAVPLVEVVVMVTIAGPAQTLSSSSQIHLHHLIRYEEARKRRAPIKFYRNCLSPHSQPAGGDQNVSRSKRPALKNYQNHTPVTESEPVHSRGQRRASGRMRQDVLQNQVLDWTGPQGFNLFWYKHLFSV